MASILETFFILFESNADEVKTGAKEAEKATEGLEKRTKAADVAAGKLGGSFVELARSAVGALAAVASVTAVSASVFAAANAADQLGKFSEALELNIEDVDAWGRAVKLNGGSAEEFQGTVARLSQGFAEFAARGSGELGPFFQSLGIQMTDAAGNARDVLQVLPELADAFQGLNRQEAFGLGKKLGLDEGTIMLLQRGRREVEDAIKRQKQLGAVTQEDAEIAAEFNDALDESSFAFRNLYLGVASNVLPPLTWMLNKLRDLGGWLSEHEDLVTGFFIAAGIAITAFYLPAILSAAAATLVAIAPFLAIGAAITAAAAAFALLYEDIVAFREGSDSMIGQIAEKWPIVGDIVNAWVDYLVLLKDTALAVFGLLGDLITDPANAWDNFVEKLAASFDVFTRVGGAVRGVFDSIASGWNTVKSLIPGFGAGPEAAALSIGKQQLAMAGATPLASTPGSAIIAGGNTSSRSTNVQVGKVEVNTQATDADGIAAAVGTSLETQIAQATSTFDDGVSH